MADSEDDDRYENLPPYSCILHCDPGAKGNITTFSEQSWSRFLEFVNKWRTLDGRQSDIARDFLVKHSDSDQWQRAAGLASVGGPPQHTGYHRSCYSRFTDRNKFEKVKAVQEKRQQKSSETGTVHIFISALGLTRPTDLIFI